LNPAKRLVNRRWTDSSWFTSCKVEGNVPPRITVPAPLKFGREMKNHNADIGHVTNTAIFVNSGWWTAAILKMALWLTLFTKRRR